MPERRTESGEDPFQAATFEGAAELRRTLVRQMSLHDRMRWLEEMNQLIAFQKARSAGGRKRGPFDRLRAGRNDG